MRPLCVFRRAATAALPVASSGRLGRPAWRRRGVGSWCGCGAMRGVGRALQGERIGAIPAFVRRASRSRAEPLDVVGEEALRPARTRDPGEQPVAHLVRIRGALLDGRREPPRSIASSRSEAQSAASAAPFGRASRRRTSASVRSRAMRSSSARSAEPAARTRAASTSAATEPATASRSARLSRARTAPRAIRAATTPATRIASAGIDRVVEHPLPCGGLEPGDERRPTCASG